MVARVIAGRGALFVCRWPWPLVVAVAAVVVVVAAVVSSL